jgi:hypothetical protein
MKYRSKFLTLCLAAATVALLATSCWKDDSPYPNEKAAFASFAVRGAISTRISPSELKVYVELADSVDIEKVLLTNVSFNYDNTKVSPDLKEGNYLNMSSDLSYTLTTYEDYVWTIVTTQNIERYFNVDKQYGAATFDATAHTVTIQVSPAQPLNSIAVKAAKLGNYGSTITPDPKTVTDFSSPVVFTVTFKGKTQTWSVKVSQSSEAIYTGSVNAYAKHADVEGDFTVGDGTPSFQYKKTSDSDWTTLPSSNVTVSAGHMTAAITNLEPNTEYQYIAICGSQAGATKTFKTEDATQLENSSFDTWYKEGTTWYPNIDLTAAHYIWDSGNKGENSLGEKNPTCPEETIVVKGKAAKLQSLSIVSVFAAGNLFTGHYVSTSGLSAKLSFGIPFTSRPQGLHGYYNYQPGVIDKTDSPYDSYKGKTDSCQIYALLTDWTEPFIANSANQTFIDYYNDPNIIARCQLLDGTNTGGYKEFNLKFEYLSTTRIPKYILVVATSSHRGDYFTGSTQSILYVDEFELVYK